jgi:class 3 adenylate cyclase
LDYVETFCPDLNIDSLCEEAGLPRAYLMSETDWSSIIFAKDFTELCIEKSKIPDICYQVGRLSISQEKMGKPIYYWAKYTLTTEDIYQKMSSIVGMFNRVLKCQVTSKARGCLEFQFQFEDAGLTAEEKDALYENIPNVLENTRGYLEAIPTIHGSPPAQVLVLPQDDSLLYVFRVTYQSYQPLVKRYAWLGLVLLMGLAGLGASEWLFSVSLLTSFAIGGVLSLSSACFYLMRLYLRVRKAAQTNDETVQSLDRQYSELHKTKESLQRRLQETELLNELIQDLVKTNSRPEILEKACRHITQILEYDRALIFLVNPKTKRLVCEGSIGLPAALQERIKDYSLPLAIDDPDPKKLSNVFRNREGVLIRDVVKHLKTLTTEGKEVLQLVGSRSFLAVPIYTDKSALGVLCVDYQEQRKYLSEEDLKLMSGVAHQIAIALENVNLLEELKKNLEVTNQYSIEQKNLRKIFQKFVPKNLSSQIVHLGNFEFQEKFLQRVKKDSVTVLFADIFDFSKLSQQLKPEEVVQLLNIAFSKLTPCVEQAGGFVDKYTGDGLMAVFEGETASTDSCVASLRMVHAVAKVNEELKAAGFPDIAIGIGLHHGPVILGNIGSASRLNFTVIGESVNLAARLESYTRSIGPNSICVSEVVRLQAGDRFVWDSLGAIELKGFPIKQTAYSLKPLTNKLEADSLLSLGSTGLEN